MAVSNFANCSVLANMICPAQFRKEDVRQRTTTMEATASNQRRLGVLLSFVLGMPVLALPAVNRQLERWGWEAANHLGISASSTAREGTTGRVAATARSGQWEPKSAARSETDTPEAAEMGRIMQNLQSLGATSWQLEQLPSEPVTNGIEPSARYRFIAGVTGKSGGSARPTSPRRFAAQAPDALSAMRAVEREVARWRRSPGTGD